MGCCLLIIIIIAVVIIRCNSKHRWVSCPRQSDNGAEVPREVWELTTETANGCKPSITLYHHLVWQPQFSQTIIYVCRCWCIISVQKISVSVCTVFLDNMIPHLIFFKVVYCKCLYIKIYAQPVTQKWKSFMWFLYFVLSLFPVDFDDSVHEFLRLLLWHWGDDMFDLSKVKCLLWIKWR